MPKYASTDSSITSRKLTTGNRSSLIKLGKKVRQFSNNLLYFHRVTYMTVYKKKSLLLVKY